MLCPTYVDARLGSYYSLILKSTSKTGFELLLNAPEIPTVDARVVHLAMHRTVSLVSCVTFNVACLLANLSPRF